jgi:hypothetical protein
VTTRLERAVIEAARRWEVKMRDGLWDGVVGDLINAVQALDADGTTEIEWHELAEGDQLKSVKNGRFYEVTGVIALKDGHHITLAGVPKPIVRPAPAEPRAFVKRGATGRAVDLFILSSGGTK